MSNLTISQMAKASGVRVDEIRNIILKERIKPMSTRPKTLDNVQQGIIARILFYEGKTEWLIFESKMNKN
jgi:hypothetical protein